MMLAMASASIVPAIERWGVLATNLGATVIVILGALYVFGPHLLLSSLISTATPRMCGCTHFEEGSMHLLMTLSINCHRVLWTTIRFGEELRAYIDVGFSTIADT